MKFKIFDLVQYMKDYPYWKYFLKCSKLFFNPFLHTKLFKARISIMDAVEMDAYLAQDNSKLNQDLKDKLKIYKHIIKYKGD